MRRILSTERQQELVSDYQTGMKRVDISQKYDLDPQQIYAFLRKNGVEANRQAKPKYDYYCVVCGDKRPRPPYSPNHIWRSLPTCGDEACKSIFLVKPELRLRQLPPSTRTIGSRNRPPRTWRNNMVDTDVQRDIITLDAAELAALEKAFHLNEDERGVDAPQTARDALWGRLTTLSVAVHLRATVSAETSLALPRRRPLETFLKTYFGRADETLVRAFDVLYLWRCACPQQQTYVIRSLEEFPKEAGDYGVCPMCAAAALEIR